MRVMLGSIAALAMISSAFAADLPVKAPPPVAPPPWTWNGFYIGINGGYSWGRSNRDLNFFNPVTGVNIATVSGGGRKLTGGVFGGQIGYNWQVTNWVFGIESDAQWTGQKGDTTVLCPVAGCFPGLAVAPGLATSASLNDKLQWFGTTRGRIGYNVVPTIMIYATGGAAYGEVQTDLGLTAFTAGGIPVTAVGSNRTTRFGWSAGGGVEAMFAPNWSVKAEYLYVDLGTTSNSALLPTAAGFPLGVSLDRRLTDNIVRAGINYHFNWGPGPAWGTGPVARY
jgi:outer membrane immunogenic protein